MRGVYNYIVYETYNIAHSVFTGAPQEDKADADGVNSTQSELLEVMALQVRLDEKRKTKATELGEEEEEEKDGDE